MSISEEIIAMWPLLCDGHRLHLEGIIRRGYRVQEQQQAIVNYDPLFCYIGITISNHHPASKLLQIQR